MKKSKQKAKPDKKLKLGQLKFSGEEFKNRIFFGGSYCTKRSHRIARPLSMKYPIHLVLKSSRAVGEKSFWKKENARFIKETIQKQGRKWGIEIKNCVNVGNHLHLLIRLHNLKAYQRFVRAVCGAIGLHLTGWNKTKGENEEKFWDFRPYTRIVVGLRAFLGMRDYLAINELEGLGSNRFEAKMMLQKIAGNTG